MANHGLIVGLDVGTNTVKALAADVRDQQANVIAVGRAVSHGVKKGVVVDINTTAKDIQLAVNQVNEQSNQKVTDVIASIPAANIQIQNVSGMVTVKDSQHISYEDVANVVADAITIDLPSDRQVIDLLPTEFSVDDFDGIQDPNDMVGMRLAMKGIVYTAPSQVLVNLRKAIEQAGLRVRDFVLAPLADMSSILNDAEQEFGTVMLDFGAGHSTATIVQDRQLRFVSVFPAGGDNITKDISTVLNIAHHEAEMLKLDAGVALPAQASHNNLMIKPVGAEEQEPIDDEYFAQIIAARVDQILSKLEDKLRLVDAFKLQGGFILIGGGAALRGIAEAVQQKYGVNAKVFVPSDLGLRHPMYARAWALVQHAARQSTIQLAVKQALYSLPVQALRENAVVQIPKVEKKQAQASNVSEEQMTPTAKPQQSVPKQQVKEPTPQKVKNWLSSFFE